MIHHIKQDQKLKRIPIIVLTSSSHPKDVETCYLYGANSHLLKPIGMDGFKDTIKNFLYYW